MATVFDPPEGMKAPAWGDIDSSKSFSERSKELNKREVEFTENLRLLCKKQGNGDIRGEEIRTGVGDGYARYMVFKTKPFQIIHMPLGDAWSASEIWERGLRVSDARKMVEADKAMAKLFGGK